MHAFGALYFCQLGAVMGIGKTCETAKFSSSGIYAHNGVKIIAIACIVFAQAS